MSGVAAITGVGSLGPAGEGLAAAAELFGEARPRLGAVERSPVYHRGAERSPQVAPAEFDAGRYIPAAARRRMSRPSILAVSAARMALEDAGVEPAVAAGEGTAVAVATSFGPSDFTERLLRQIYDRGPETASPFLFTESVANAAAAQIALALRARGANLTVTQREAGMLVGLELGARELELGRAERVMAGAVEEMVPLLHAVLERFRALSRCRDGGRSVARPFDRRRSGFLAAEGAVVAVLETPDAAASRGARVHARLRPLGSAFDPAAPRAGWSRDPEPLSRALERLLARAEVPIESIDRVVAGASGARGHDRLEGLLLRRVWGRRPLPPILAPKAWLGEHAGAGLVGALLAVAGARFAPTPGFAEPDPEIGVEPHRGGELGRASRVLVSALAAGGSAAWALVEEPSEGDPPVEGAG